MTKLIQPRTLKGFRDFLPEVMMPREQIIQTARDVYRGFGFCPIDTPVLEYLEILTGKGSEETDKQLYRFQDHGKRDVGMRFDLTIPLARFSAQHISALGTPFKRYHIAPVWRGENTQAGRYREFMQCDFDTIGTESVVADIETGAVIDELLRRIGIERFQIRINNRQILNGLLEKHGLGEKGVPILRSLDKLDKIGTENVLAEMQSAAGISQHESQLILELANATGPLDDVLRKIESIVAGSELAESGLDRLQKIARGLKSAGVSSERFAIDVSIARGLDYYTGVVFETTLTDLPKIGSICSGGRYDNLAGLYTKQHLPGIGASLGLDRLLAAMEQLEMLPKTRTPAPVFIAYFDRERLDDYLQMATILRQHGIGVELYPDPKKLGVQLKYASQRGHKLAVIAGSDELDEGKCQIKKLATKQSAEHKWRGAEDEFASTVDDLLST